MAALDFAGPTSAAAIAEQVARYKVKTIVKKEGVSSRFHQLPSLFGSATYPGCLPTDRI
jgi:hypothetical protein